MKKKKGLPPVHPGEFIGEDILPEVGLSVTAVAKALGVSRQMVMTFWPSGSLCPLLCV
jgi:plasmid maintenance system antidote protein VapI